MNYRRMIGILVAGMLVAGWALARGRKIKRSELPPAVETTLEAEVQGATVKRLSQENEHGRLYYKANLKVDGHSKEFLIKADGHVLMVKEQVPVDSLPSEVKTALKKKAGFLGSLGRIDHVEAITRNDRLEGYEARVDKPVLFIPGAGVSVSSSTVRVGPDGKQLDKKEWPSTDSF